MSLPRRRSCWQIPFEIMKSAVRTNTKAGEAQTSQGMRKLAKVIYGLSAHSIALLADAGHNFGDVLGLLLAWGAHVLARRQPTARYTYGYRSASILSALINAVLLLVATGAIAWEAIGRFSNPGEVAGKTVMLVAGVAVIVNAGSAWLLIAGREGDQQPCRPGIDDD